MRAKQSRSKKIGEKTGKRTHILRDLVQRDIRSSSNEKLNERSHIFNLVNIEEDLLESNDQEKLFDNIDIVTQSQTKKMMIDDCKMAPSNGIQNLSFSFELISRLIQNEITKIADSLELEQTELEAWVTLQVTAPNHIILTLLRMANGHQLDPLKEEVALALYDDGKWQAYITVEGYSKILNRHPAFDGIGFTQSQESTNGIPVWMECTIYRKDRGQPIVVREYFEEVKGEQAIWQKMPRRMLRHRVMQQCARLAF